MKKIFLTGFLALTLLILLAYSCLFVVDQRQFALVYGGNKVQKIIAQPGLQIKLPWPLQTVKNIDKRVFTSDGDASAPVPTADRQAVLFDWYVRWRITDPAQYLAQVGETERAGKAKLDQAVRTALQTQTAALTAKEVFSTQRQTLAQQIKQQVQAATQGAQPWGMEVLDVRLTRVDVDAAATEAIYTRMRAQGQSMAAELRGQGQSEVEKIRAQAEQQRDATLTQARMDAEKIKGEGDAQASRIYAENHAKNPQFAHFLRTLEVYKRSFNQKTDVLVIDPANNDFFKSIKQGATDTAKPPALPAKP